MCNLLVVVTYIYNRFRSNSEDSDSDSEDTPATRRHSNLPSGRTTKPSVAPQSTVLVLTDLESDFTGASYSRGGRGATSTFMTWKESEHAWVPRAPPSALPRPTHHRSTSVPSTLEDGLQQLSLTRVASEPSLVSSLPSRSGTKSVFT